MTDFSLAHYADEALTAATDADYDAIAKAMTALIPHADREAALVQLCRIYLMSYKPRLSRVREAATPAGKGQRSAKVAAYQQHARFFRILVQTGPNANKWMGECTYEDLMHAARIRHEQASAIAAAAEDHERLAALVKRHKAATVQQLPPQVVETFLTERGQRRVAA